MDNILEDFLSWLKVHSMGFRMRHDAMGWEIDYGYIKACDVIKTELQRLIQEHKDGTDRVGRDPVLLEDQIS